MVREFPSPNAVRQVAVIFVIALVLRLAALAAWEWKLGADTEFGFGDSNSYWRLAETISKGEPYQFGSPMAQVFRSPGYPILLAPIFWLVAEDWQVCVARLFNVLLGCCSVVCVFRVARSMGLPAKIGALSSLAAALYPGWIFQSVLVLSETPFVFFMLLEIESILRLARSGRRNLPMRRHLTATWIGVLHGICSLIRPDWLLVGLPLLCWYVWYVRGGAAKAKHSHQELGVTCRLALLASVAFVAVMSPWAYRNYQVTRSLVFTNLQTGASLYDGLNPEADGGSNMRPIDSERIEFMRSLGKEAELSESELQQLLPTDILDKQYWPKIKNAYTTIWSKYAAGHPESVSFEVLFDQFLRERALAWAQSSPGSVLSLAFWKFVRFWSPLPVGEAWANSKLKWGFAIPYLLFVGIGLFAGSGAWKRLAAEFPLWGGLFISMALHLVFVSSLRYRDPFILPLFLLAALGLVALSKRLSLGFRS